MMLQPATRKSQITQMAQPRTGRDRVVRDAYLHTPIACWDPHIHLPDLTGRSIPSAVTNIRQSLGFIKYHQIKQELLPSNAVKSSINTNLCHFLQH